VCRILVSYWYYKKRDLGDFGRQTRLPVRLFADSGAFTAYTMRAKGGQIRREDYAAWLREWQPLLSAAINLDVIGDHRASMRNQLWLEGQGLNVRAVHFETCSGGHPTGYVPTLTRSDSSWGTGLASWAGSYAMAEHRHEWEDWEVGCEDCGSHPAVRCADPQCDSEPIDLIYNDDPREAAGE
jgi:hypothetical protein